MQILDANAVLRYLLRDIPDMAEEARNAVMAGASTTAEVLAEVVYVLAGVYGAECRQIAETVGAFLEEVEVPHPLALRYAFRLYGQSKLDFVDCVLAGYHHVDGAEILTFDKKLLKALRTNPIGE